MNPFTTFLPTLTKRMQSIVKARYATRNAPTLVYHMIEYHLGWRDADLNPTQVDSGKRLRPIMLLLSCEAFGGQWRHALNAAAAVEMLHNFTLIHDDIEDRDTVRRGRPTLWTLWGIPQALNAGDALFALSYDALLDAAPGTIPADVLLTMNQRFTQTVLHLTEGQCEDMAFEETQNVAEQRYLDMIGGKTAALLGLVCELGARMAQTSEPYCTLVNRFGTNLGYAFQMQDDVLGIWGNPERTGKPVGSDLLKHKKTLPILHGMQQSAELSALLNNTDFSESDVETALRLFEQTGSQAYAQDKANTYLDRALTSLDNSNATGPAVEALHDIVKRLINREK